MHARAGDGRVITSRALLRIAISSKMPADSPSPGAPEPPPAAPPKPAPLRQVAGAVFWSFFGVRKARHMAEDTTTIKLHHLIIVGLLSLLVFVLALVALVTFITRGT